MQMTQSQMNALDVTAFEGFVRRVLVFVDTECDFSRPYDGSCVPQGAARERVVRDLLARARSYGICTELGLVQFVIVGLGYSRTFESLPKVQAMLTHPMRLPDDSIQQVLNAVIVAEARRA